MVWQISNIYLNNLGLPADLRQPILSKWRSRTGNEENLQEQKIPGTIFSRPCTGKNAD